VRVRLTLCVALVLVVAGAFAVLSQRADRMAGSNGIGEIGFPVVVGPGKTVCQHTTLSDDTRNVVMLVGTYGRPVPRLSLTFRAPDGRQLASGAVPAGKTEGHVTVPLSRTADGSTFDALACVRNGGTHRIALGGDIEPQQSAATVNGRPTSGGFALRYLRPGDESWWQLIPTISTRFGLGKAPIFGDWTLPIAALVLLAVWIAAIRLVLRTTP
jgi:hypothetical protein